MKNKKEQGLLKPPRVKPVTGEIYHVYNRGVEKRRIFLNHRDRLRFIWSLIIFNDEAPTDPNIGRLMEVGLPSILPIHDRKMLVDILAFVLMDNHYHLMVKQKQDEGITEFMRKLGTGYTNYFNLKYDRVGALFQSKYKIVRITNERQLFYLPYYIHLNPLDYLNKNWRTDNIKRQHLPPFLNYLNSFRWSSHLDYIGQRNFPDVTNRTFLTDLLGQPAEYTRDLIEWLEEEKGELADLQPITLE